MGDLDRAIEFYQQALFIEGISDVNRANICRDLGLIYQDKQDWTNALKYYQQQYPIKETYLPIDRPDLILHFDSIINIFKKKDQIDQAIEFCQEQLSRHENHPHLLISLATMYGDKNPKIADQYYQQANVQWIHVGKSDIGYLLQSQQQYESIGLELETKTGNYDTIGPFKCDSY